MATRARQGTNENVHSRGHEYQVRLNAIHERIYEADDLTDVLAELKDELCSILQVERIIVYERSSDGREIFSRFKTGEDIGVIRLPLSPSSIAGYVAMSQNSLRIDDVYDAEQLTTIHSRLHFDYSCDQVSGFLTRSMMAVPICFGEVLLGVLQLINRVGATTFSDQDLIMAQGLAQVLAQKICFDRETTQGPYEYLVQQELLTNEQLEVIQEKAVTEETTVTSLLQSELSISVEEIGASLEQYYQVPFMAYAPDIELPMDLLDTLNKPFLVRNIWVPVAGDRDKAVILIDNPTDAGRIMDIQRILNAETYEFMVGLEEDILNYLGVEPEEKIELIEEPQTNLDDLVGRLSEEQMDKKESAEAEGEEDLLDENATAVVQLVNKLIADGVALNASDIHVEPSKGENPGTVRMRVDGVCREVLQIPAKHVRYVVARIKIMSKVDIAESRLPQDGKISCRLQGNPLELRVATLPTVNGESVIMRIFAAGDPLPFDKLNFAPQNEEAVEGMLTHPHGIVLVVGPTGSGKTTTLHALLGHINTPDRKILTAEDPVEITQPGLQQLQVQSDIGLDFARALRAFLRSDPDIILIGEMRDLETAHSGIEASLTGHLVFSTLHTNSAAETITRLLDMGLDPLNFSDALIGVVAQRLVRTLCSNCKEPYSPSSHEMETLISEYGAEYFPELGINEAELELYRPTGCEACGGSGYKGRTGLHEVLTATPKIKELIVGKGGASLIKDTGMDAGMRILIQDGVRKVFAGQCDLKQVRAVALT